MRMQGTPPGRPARKSLAAAYAADRLMPSRLAASEIEIANG